MTSAAQPRRRSDYSLTGPRAALAAEAGLADARWYATPVPKAAMRALLQRRDGPAVRDTLLWFALLGISGAAGAALWGTAWAILPFAIYGILFASVSDSRWHETGHGTAFRTDWLNNAVYELASFMVSRESVMWRWSHARHHSDTLIAGRDREIGQMRPVSLPRVVLKFINVPYLFLFYRNVLRHAAGRVAPDEATFIPPSEYPRLFRTARVYLLVYAGVIGLAAATGSLLPLMFTGLPSFYGAWLQTLYGIQQHAGLAEDVLDHRLNTRTVYLNRLNKYLYWNMGYHIEHHMFPLVPYYNLDRLHALVKWDMPRPYRGLLDAYREVIPALIRQATDGAYYIKRELPPPAPTAAVTGTAETITSAAEPDAEGWVAICPLDRLLPGDVLRFEHGAAAAGGTGAYAIYRTFDGRLYASAARCTHANAQLTDGFLQGVCIECPKHNGRFDIRDGSVRRPPPREPLKTYPVRERGGTVYLQVR